jgi:hypothetical protein
MTRRGEIVGCQATIAWPDCRTIGLPQQEFSVPDLQSCDSRGAGIISFTLWLLWKRNSPFVHLGRNRSNKAFIYKHLQSSQQIYINYKECNPRAYSLSAWFFYIVTRTRNTHRDQFYILQGISKKALQLCFKCYNLASVMKTFTLKGIQIIHRSRWSTIAKLFLKHLALREGSVTIPGNTRLVLLHCDSSKHCTCPLNPFI